MAGQERCTPPREHIDRTAPRSALWLPIRETATLDRLSSGRLTLGVGLGSERFGSELSKTGEQLDDRLRGQMLDEALEILTAAWSGAPVHHRGEHYTVEGI
jgi:alkanesulfonate monooxygenase SsuD/methylene tetrahydromethanopterin reductase-like flavin-dependent oxidoreductase (luciferase family)